MRKNNNEHLVEIDRSTLNRIELTKHIRDIDFTVAVNIILAFNRPLLFYSHFWSNFVPFLSYKMLHFGLFSSIPEWKVGELILMSPINQFAVYYASRIGKQSQFPQNKSENTNIFVF